MELIPTTKGGNKLAYNKKITKNGKIRWACTNGFLKCCKGEILAATAGIFGIRGDKCQMDKAEIQAYREAFSNFDWNHNGKISYGSLLPAMRRAGVNPTEVN